MFPTEISLTTSATVRNRSVADVFDTTKIILPDNQYTETKYDLRGRIVEEIDQTGSSTKYAYDNADHLISVTDNNGSTWTYDYDVQGNITCVTDPQGNKTAYTFGKMNRLVKTTLPQSKKKIVEKGFHIFTDESRKESDSWTQYCYNIDYRNGWLYEEVQAYETY